MFNLDFLKQKKKFVKHGTQPDPSVYWMGIFFLGFLLTIISFIYGFYIFMQVGKENPTPPLPPNKLLEKISKNRFDKVLNVFDERAKKTNELLQNPPSVVDPSL